MRIAGFGLLLLAGHCLCLSRAEGQTPRQRALGAPELEFDGEFTRVTAVREYSDGRAILLDSRDRIVYLLDPSTKSIVRIGREGGGPGEYSRPNGLVLLPADSILVADGANNRYLVLGAGGRMLGTLPLVTIRPNPNTTYGIDVGATDAAGRMYFLLPRGLVQSQDAGTPVVRLDRRTQLFDTVGRVFAPTLTTTAMQSAGSGASFGMISAPPFGARDEWAVGPDASVAMVRAEPYHVEWTSPRGVVTRGAPVAYAPVEVDAAEKEEWRVQARARSGTLTTTDANGRTTTRTVPVPEPEAWPRVKPPFVAPVFVASNGNVWVERSRAVRDTVTSYDVFSTTGRHAERVTMSVSRRVIGFGNGTIYVTRKDEDDLLHLERYRTTP